MPYIPAVLIWTGLRRSPLSDGHEIQGLTQGQEVRALGPSWLGSNS